MVRRCSRFFAAVVLASVAIGNVGCSSEVLGPEFMQFLRDTAKDTAIAIGAFVVESTVTATFD